MEHNQPDNALVSAYSLTEKSPIDPETVQKAMRGDDDAFSTLFMQTYRPMFLVVRRFLKRDEDIYDAMQNGYLKAYKYLPGLQSPEAFPVWLKKIMENAARDIRADLADMEIFCEDINEFPDEPAMDCMESSESRADIQGVLSQLDSRQAQVLTLYYYDGMKLSEIAKMLGEPPSTIRSRFAKAKRTLVERLKVKGIDKSMYSGSASAMIAVCLRSLIGTDILSAVTAQQMLDDILKNKPSKLGGAAYKLLEKQRNRTILKAVSCLMALTVAVSCVTAALLNGFPRKWFSVQPPVSGGAADPKQTTADAPKASGPDIGGVAAVSSESKPPDSNSTSLDSDSTSPDSDSTSPDSDLTSLDSESMPPDSDSTSLEPDWTPPFSDSMSSPFESWTSPFSESTSPSFGSMSPASRTTAPSSRTTSPSSGTTTAPSGSTPSEAEFVPDYSPGQANTAGNTSNNVGVNRGFVAKQADWLYFAEGNGYRVLMKMKTDGSQKQFVAEDSNGFEYINVLGDWIYYCGNGIWRMRTDGSQRELISTLNAVNLYITQNTGYFMLRTDASSPIYRIDLSTKKVTILQKREGNSPITVSNDKILYCEQNKVQVLDLKTYAVHESLEPSSSGVLVNGNLAYYISDGQLLSWDYTNPESAAKLIRHVSAWGYPLFMSSYKGGIIGCWRSNSGNGYLTLTTLSGTSLQWQSTEEVDVDYHFYTFGDDYVYFYTPDLTLHRARADGSDFSSFS